MPNRRIIEPLDISERERLLWVKDLKNEVHKLESRIFRISAICSVLHLEIKTDGIQSVVDEIKSILERGDNANL